MNLQYFFVSILRKYEVVGEFMKFDDLIKDEIEEVKQLLLNIR